MTQRDLSELKRALGENAAELCRDLFGEPTFRSRRELRWGRRGSARLNLTGRRGPSFYDFERAAGGSMLDAIALALGCGFPEAVRWGRQWLGEDGERPEPRPRPAPVAVDIDDREATNRRKARELWLAGHAAHGTAAARYLIEQRSVDRWPGGAARFIGRDAVARITGWRWWPSGALILPLTDDAGGIVSVQMIAVRDDGVPLPRRTGEGGKLKQTIGPRAGAAVRLAPEVEDGPLVLAEGAETALSVWTATGFEAWALLGSIASARLATIDKGRTIVVAADDDPRAAPANKALRDAIRKWREEGRTVLVVKPWLLSRGDKSDFNDALRAGGAEAVRERFDAVLGPAQAPGRAGSPAMQARRDLANAMAGAWRELMAWRAGEAADRPPFIALEVGTGLGKTAEAISRAVQAVAEGHKVAFAVPTHRLGDELVERIEAEGRRRGVTVCARVRRGREATRPDGSGDPMCADLATVREAQRVFADTTATVCRVCEHRDACPWLAQRDQTANVWIVAHESLFHALPAALNGTSVLVIDEGFALKGLRGVQGRPSPVTAEDLRRQPMLDSLAATNDLVADLMPIRRLLLDALDGIEAGPVRWDRLAAGGLTADMAREAARLEWRAKVEVDVDDQTTRRGLREKLRAAAGNALVARLAGMWAAVADFLDAGGPGKCCGRIEFVEDAADEAGARRSGLRVYGCDGFGAGWAKIPTLHLDATLNEALLRARVPHARIAARISAAAPHMRIVQYADRAFSKAALAHDGGLLPRVWDWAKAAAARVGGDWLLIAPKDAEVAIRERWKIPKGMALAHLAAVSGLDEYRDVAGLVVIGRLGAPPSETERLAGIITGFAPEQAVEGWYPGELVTLAGREGAPVTVEADRHPDQMVEAIRRSIYEGELVQAIGRARGVNRTAGNPVEVHVLGNVPLPLPVDEVRAWAPATIDERMLGDGVWLSNSRDAAAVYPDLGSAEVIKKARQRAEQKGTFPYNRFLYGNVPHCSLVSYQRAGERLRPARAVFDTRQVPDPQAWLVERLGPLADFEILEADAAGAGAVAETQPAAGTAQPAHHRPMPAPEPEVIEMRRAVGDHRVAPSVFFPVAGSGWRDRAGGDGLAIRVRMQRPPPVAHSAAPVESLAARPRPAGVDRWTWRGGVAFDPQGAEVGRVGRAGLFVPRPDYAFDDAWWPVRRRAAAWADVRPPPAAE